MTRRSVKKIDYSKFATSGSSSDDDDFECTAPPPVKRAKENLKSNKNNKLPVDKTTKKKQTKEKNSNQQTEKCSSSTTERKPRSSRTSNAERIYEDELNAALQKSKKRSEKTKKDDNIADVCDFITIEDDDSSDERIMKIVACKKSGTESEGSAFADTLPIIQQDHPQQLQLQPIISNNSPINTEDSSQIDDDEDQFNKSLKTTDSEDDPVRRNLKATGILKTTGRYGGGSGGAEKETNTKNKQINAKILSKTGQSCDTTIEETDDENSPVKRSTNRTKTKKNDQFTRVSRFSDSAPLSEKEDNVSPAPKRSVSLESSGKKMNADEEQVNKFRVASNNVAPSSRLRLGLSRHRKISKPLHQNVSFKFVS